jgi:hypothetical protein
MAKPKTVPSDTESFAVQASAIADERYSGRYDRGFAHLALQLAFPNFEFTDDQVEELIAVDRHGDLGVDAVYIDKDEEQVLLFQSKSSAGLGDTELHKEISAFLRSTEKLLDDAWVRDAHQDMQALANEFRAANRTGYTVVFAFATASEISERQRSTFGDACQSPGLTAEATVLLLDPRDLEDRYEKILLAIHNQPTDVQFEVREDQMHQPDESDIPVMYLTIPAREYVGACKKYGMELFRYNPRLYLGVVNKVNAGIAETLNNESERRWFHLLNNGITAVCQGIRGPVAAGGGKFVLQVDDFQVVNGCQTTMTLFRNSERIAKDDLCLVDIKIISSEGLRDRVSQTTNTQTAILVEDSFANAAEQRHIADLLRRYDPPYFYAPKRGAWDQARDKRSFAEAGGAPRRYRKLTSKELAAVCLAIFGEPESAKDRPRIVFEKTAGKNSSLYERIFEARNTAAQWILPWELLRHASSFIKKTTDEARENCPDDDSECPELTRARIQAYGRFRMIYLAYQFLREHTGSSDRDFIDPRASDTLLRTIGDWGENLLVIAGDAVVDAYEDAQKRGESSGLREFFREKRHQPLVDDRFRAQLERNRRTAQRNRQDLTEALGLPPARNAR